MRLTTRHTIWLTIGTCKCFNLAAIGPLTRENGGVKLGLFSVSHASNTLHDKWVLDLAQP